VILVFYDMQPRKDILLELLRTDVLRLVLDVKYRRQVSRLQMDHGEEDVGLPACRRVVAPEMIDASYKARFLGVIEIFPELRIKMTVTLCRFYDDEADGRPFYHRIPESVPVDCPLVPAYIDAVDGISGRIIRISVNSTPSEAGGFDKKEIKKEAIQYSKTYHSNPSHPARNVVPGFYD